jgi:hypothetical protein
VVTAERGDQAVVPPGLPHAFAAAPGHDEIQELYDTYFRTSPTWDAARPGPTSAI